MIAADTSSIVAYLSQSCLDHKVRLITRDRDFLHFARAAGLRLLAD